MGFVNWSQGFLEARSIFQVGGEKSRNRLLLIFGIRLLTQLAVLAIATIFQFRQPQFISMDVIGPLYFMLTVTFLINAAYVIFFDQFFVKSSLTVASLFLIDVVFVTALIFYTGVNQSIFLFMYLVYIALAGFVFQRRGALMLALFTSVCFSVQLILGPEIRGQTLYFAVGLNNLAFLAVAGLSGYLSEQMNFMGDEIHERDLRIRSLEDLNNLIITNISTGIITVSNELKVLQHNKAAQDILDKRIPFREEQLSALIPEMIEVLKEFLDPESSSYLGRFEIEHINKKGENLTLGMSLSPLTTTDGRREGAIIIFQDLTQIKRMEKALRRSEKLAAVGQLAAGIAHEIRNPLASISGSVQLLNTDLKNPEDAKLMKIIIKEIDRLNGLITEFLDYVRPDVRVDQPVELEMLLSEVVEMCKVNDRLRRDVLVTTEFNNHQKILGHHDKLKQVFLNLLINAYQAMKETEQAKLLVKTELSGSRVKVSISDSGCGMSEDVQNRLFEPFFTTKPSGTGLGLATVHKIIENHEATITVESAKGQGTTFILEFKRLSGVGPVNDKGNEENNKIVEKYNEEINKFNYRKRGHA